MACVTLELLGLGIWLDTRKIMKDDNPPSISFIECSHFFRTRQETDAFLIDAFQAIALTQTVRNNYNNRKN